MKSKMTETIQQLKEDIAILQEKLQKLEEQDPEMLLLRQGKVDVVDYDGKKYFRIEYTDSFADTYSWYVRRIGEDAVRQVRDVNVYAPLEELYRKEVVKQKDDHPYKIADEHGETNPYKQYLNSVEDEKKMEELGFVKNAEGNWTAQPLGETTEEQVKKLRGKEWTYKITDEHGESNQYKQGLNMIKRDKETEELMTSKGYEKNSAGVWEPKKQEPLTLKDLLRKWEFDFSALWETPENRTSELYEKEIERFIHMFSEWLPKEQTANSQNTYVELVVEGFNDALKEIKGRLR